MKMLNELKERATSKTPSFFKRLRLYGAIIGGVGALIVAFPVSLPVGLVAAGGYMALIGSTAATVAQCAKENE